MSNYKRCPIVFNLDNPAQSDLYDWCMQSTSNFSDFARTVLFAYRESKRSGGVAIVAVDEALQQSGKGVSDADAEAMAGML
jgi:hypothetical protein